jgi:NAD dependent epimerase/dehydratase
MKNKEILVTGGCGFIGSHLVEMLVESGNKVICFDRYNPNNHWGWLENSEVKDDIEVILGDIRDFDSVYDAVKRVEIVFHLAALIGIPYSYISPLAYIRTNIEGTYNVLESTRLHGTDQVITTSTSETYGTAQYVPIDEAHPLVGQSPYSATKISADQIAFSYFRSFDLPVKIARPFNTYGPHQSSRAIIPTIITQVLEGKGEIKIGNTSPTRDLTYVADTCRAIIEIAKQSEFMGDVVNIGTNSEVSIQELIEKIEKISGRKVKTVQDKERIRPKKSEVERLISNNEKILLKTNWKPEISLDEGLTKTFQWFEKIDIKSLYKPDSCNV